MHGIRWTLNDVVHGRRRLKVPAPFTRRVGKDWQKDFVLEKRLAFSVEAALPLLSARILNKPEFMHEKSLAQCSIEVCNKSNVPYDSLHIAISSPHVTAGSALSQKSEQTGLDETPPGPNLLLYLLHYSVLLKRLITPNNHDSFFDESQSRTKKWMGIVAVCTAFSVKTQCIQCMLDGRSGHFGSGLKVPTASKL